MGRKLDFIVLIVLLGLIAYTSFSLWKMYPQISGNSVKFFSNESGSYGVITGGAVFEMSNGS